MVFGHLLGTAKKVWHGAGSGLNFFGAKLKGGIDWLKGTANKVDKTLKSIPMVASIYDEAKKYKIPQLGGKSVEELAGMAGQALDVGEKISGVAQSRSFGEGMARARGLGRMLPEAQRRQLDRGLGFAEAGATMLRRLGAR
jgi:hypothetical protein